MTTYGTFDIDSVPAPSPFDLEVEVRVSPFPFVAHDLTTDRLVTIVGKTDQHHYVDGGGYLHLGCDITEDLAGYAAMQAADAQDERETQRDAVR